MDGWFCGYYNSNLDFFKSTSMHFLGLCFNLQKLHVVGYGMRVWAYSNVDCHPTIVPRCVSIAKCWISFSGIVFGHCLCILGFDLLSATWPLITGWRVYLECLCQILFVWISVLSARRIQIVGQTSTFASAIYVLARRIPILTLSLVPISCGIWGFWMPMDHFGCSNTLSV